MARRSAVQWFAPLLPKKYAIRKWLFTPVNICILAAAIDAVFPNTTERYVEALHVQNLALFNIYVFIVADEQEMSCFLCS